MNEITEIHTDTDVLEGAAKTYEYLHDESFTFSRNVWLSRSSLFDTLASKYKEAADAFPSEDQSDEEVLLVVVLKKLSIFFACHDLTSWNLWDDIFDRWIKGANSDPESVPTEAVKHAIVTCHMGLVWELHLLSESRNSINANVVSGKINEFMTQMKLIMRNDRDVLEEEVIKLAHYLINLLTNIDCFAGIHVNL